MPFARGARPAETKLGTRRRHFNPLWPTSAKSAVKGPKSCYAPGMKSALPMLSLALAATLCAPCPAAAAREGAFTIAESGRRFGTLADAVAAIGNRTGTILIAPGRYRQCAVQQGGTISYRAERPGTALFDGTICEGKAALVLRGRAASIEGRVFQNLYVPDGNGSGIRLERGDLSVVNSIFRASEQGILTHNDLSGTIRIDRSTFSGLGRCDRGLDCAHSIYIGRYGRLVVTRTRFEAGTGGHYVKSRAERVELSDNNFDDRAGHATNYMIDLPNGSAGIIERNIMVQGPDKDNYSAFITIGPEGRVRDSSSLVIRGNRAGFAPGLDRSSTFVANWTADTPILADNRLAAGIRPTDRR